MPSNTLSNRDNTATNHEHSQEFSVEIVKTLVDDGTFDVQDKFLFSDNLSVRISVIRTGRLISSE